MKAERTGIPTTYDGINYRSRLEAKWGALFHLLDWEAHYEPFDLDGYIPDFILHFCKRVRVLVEVGPVTGIE